MSAATPAPAATSDEDAAYLGLGSFFISRDYTTRTFPFRVRRRPGEDAATPVPPGAPLDGDGAAEVTVEQALDSLDGANSDVDTTGQIVWLISRVTSHYVAAEGWRDVRGRAVHELGAGAGLVGLTASRWASRVVLSDYVEEVVSLLQRNLRHAAPACAGGATVASLYWDEPGDHAALDAASPDGDARVPVLLGADVVYWSASVAPLFATAARLLQRRADAVFILGYYDRVGAVKRAMLEAAEAVGLRSAEVGWAWLGPEPHPPEYEAFKHNMTLFRFTWADL